MAADGTNGYRDVEPAAWYYEAVDYCSENGIMNGMDDGLFVPDGELTRAMLVSSLYRIEGEPETDANGAFAYVDNGAWYADAVNWAYASGIISGNNENLFEPDEPITKEDTAAILWRAEGSPAVDGAEDFADETSISAYAAQAVDWARVNGVIGGDVFEIVPLEPYPEDYDAIAERSQAELAAAIARLPEQTQEEIFRYYFMRQPQRVIGVHIGRTRSTAGRHIQLALQRLRRLMEGKEHE